MIHFKTATIENAKEIARLVNSAYRGDYSKQGWTTEADLLDGQRTDENSLLELMNTPEHQFELAFDETNHLLGSIHLIKEPNKTLYFGMLTVEPSFQGKGLGKNLLAHVEEIAKKMNFNRIRFTVIPHRKELIAFYERRGFKATGNVEPFPVDPKFGLPKVTDLSLKEFEKFL